MELDKCAFDPEHMEESHNGGSFPMVNFWIFLSIYVFYFDVFNTVGQTKYFQKPMMRGSPGPPGAMRGSGPNFANIKNIHQCEIHMKPRKRKNFPQAWLKSQKDRCFIKSYISGYIRIFQPVLLDILFDAGGQYRCKINIVIIILYRNKVMYS